MKYFLFLITIGVILLIFREWFTFGLIAGGDFPYYFPKTLWDIVPLLAWDTRHGGLGSTVIPQLWIELYAETTFYIARYMSWIIYERLFWFFPIAIFSFISSGMLYKKVWNTGLWYLASLLFLCNTYSLMIIGGGQGGVAMAYGFSPFVLLGWILFINKLSLRTAIIAGLLMAIEIIFDLRLAYIVILAIALYIVFYFISYGFTKERILKGIVFTSVAGGVIVLLHVFWILPLLIFHTNPFSQFSDIYTSPASVPYFSFASFENALGLLHPNWPENIFGKVSFMKPEFLLLPLLALASLLFVNKKDKQQTHYVLFFATIGLIGIFLAKGAQDPFGNLYLWMFNHIPGFTLFRDPTKWYLLIALSYSVLVPYTIFQLMKRIKQYQYIIPIIFILYIGFLLKPAILGQLSGTFKTHTVPLAYQQLQAFISDQPQFFRTLWVPTPQTFGFFSENHPELSGEDLFHVASSSAVLNALQQKDSLQLLQNIGVKYIIVPYDSEGNLFVEDRKYSEEAYNTVVKTASQIPWIVSTKHFGKIALFEVPSPKSRFWSTDPSLDIHYTEISSTYFRLEIRYAKQGDVLIFTDSFNPYWQMTLSSGKKVTSQPYQHLLNSFILPTNGNVTLSLTYLPQQWVYIGFVISAITVMISIGVLFIYKQKK